MLSVCCWAPLGRHFSEDSLSDSEAIATSLQVQYMPRHHRRALSSTSPFTGHYGFHQQQDTHLQQQYSGQWDDCVWDMRPGPGLEGSATQPLPRGADFSTQEPRHGALLYQREQTSPAYHPRHVAQQASQPRFQFPARSISAHTPGRHNHSGPLSGSSIPESSAASSLRQRKSEGSAEIQGSSRRLFLDLRGVEATQNRKSEGQRRWSQEQVPLSTEAAEVGEWGPLRGNQPVSSRHLYLNLRGGLTPVGRGGSGERVRASTSHQEHADSPPVSFKEMAMRRAISNPRLTSLLDKTESPQKLPLTFREQALRSHEIKVKSERARSTSRGRREEGDGKEASPPGSREKERPDSRGRQRPAVGESCPPPTDSSNWRGSPQTRIRQSRSPRYHRSSSHGRQRNGAERAEALPVSFKELARRSAELRLREQGSPHRHQRPTSQGRERHPEHKGEVVPVSFKELARKSAHARAGRSLSPQYPRSISQGRQRRVGGKEGETPLSFKEMARRSAESRLAEKKGDRSPRYQRSTSQGRERQPGRSREEVAPLSFKEMARQTAESRVAGERKLNRERSRSQESRRMQAQEELQPLSFREMAKRSHRAKVKGLSVHVRKEGVGERSAISSREQGSARAQPSAQKEQHQESVEVLWDTDAWQHQQTPTPREVMKDARSQSNPKSRIDFWGVSSGEGEMGTTPHESVAEEAVPARTETPPPSGISLHQGAGRMLGGDSFYVSPKVLRDNYLMRHSETLPRKDVGIPAVSAQAKEEYKRSNSGSKVPVQEGKERGAKGGSSGQAEPMNVRFADSVEVRQLKWIRADAGKPGGEG